MRNPFPSTISLPNINPFFTRVPDLESAHHNHDRLAAAKRRFRKTRSKTRSSSHSQPVTLSSGGTSYASAFRTPLPVLSRTETISLEGVNVREQGGMLYVDAPVSVSPKLQMGGKSATHLSEGNECKTGVGCSEFEKIVHGELGLEFGVYVGLGEGGEKVNAEKEAKMRALLEKYDPGERTGCAVWNMEDHREMVRHMLLDCIIVAAGKLRKYGWIIGSKNEKFRSLCTHERWDTMLEDLMQYTKAVEAYESWCKCCIHGLEFGPLSLPLLSDRYGRTLAVIEVASKSEDPEEIALSQELSRSLMHSHATWWRSRTLSRPFLDFSKRTKMNKATLGSRLAIATSGGMALIFPMLIMVLDPGLTSRLITTSIFTIAVGCILACWMVDASQDSLLAMAAAYAAVLVVFVGSGITA